jgi:protein-S-isoprenylcysteine O-methyltransferase Ste14
MKTEITPEIRQKITKRVRQVVVTTVIQGLFLFLAAGTVRWAWGWVYVGVYLLGILINAVLLLRANPGVIAERAENKGVRKWDLLWGGIAFGMISLGLPVVGGLDFRFGWTGDFILWLHWAGVGLFFLGGVLFAWAMAHNAKFATVVRVGEEGAHPVATDGPYRIVRHPGYLGACLQAVGLPLLFGSWWSCLAAAIALVAVVIRTALEDRALQSELPGYDRLVAQTRYKLMPGVW